MTLLLLGLEEKIFKVCLLFTIRGPTPGPPGAHLINKYLAFSNKMFTCTSYETNMGQTLSDRACTLHFIVNKNLRFSWECISIGK